MLHENLRSRIHTVDASRELAGGVRSRESREKQRVIASLRVTVANRKHMKVRNGAVSCVP